MPQMAPLNWLGLFIMFITILILFNSLNYFLFNYNLSSNLKSPIKTLINWKW